MIYSISTDKAAYFPAEPVLLRVEIRNHSNQNVRVHLDESNFSFELFKNEDESPFRTGKIKVREGISFDPDVTVEAGSASTYSLVLNEGVSTRLPDGQYRVKVRIEGHFLVPKEIPGVVVRLEFLPAEILEFHLLLLPPDDDALDRIVDGYLAEELRLKGSTNKGNYEIVRKKLLYAESNRAADFKAKVLMEGRDVWEQRDAFESLKALGSPEAIEALKKAKNSSAELKGVLDYRKEIEKVIDAEEAAQIW